MKKCANYRAVVIGCLGVLWATSALAFNNWVGGTADAERVWHENGNWGAGFYPDATSGNDHRPRFNSTTGHQPVIITQDVDVVYVMMTGGEAVVLGEAGNPHDVTLSLHNSGYSFRGLQRDLTVNVELRILNGGMMNHNSGHRRDFIFNERVQIDADTLITSEVSGHATFEFNDAVHGAGGLIFTGNNNNDELFLHGVNTYTGSTALNNGILRVPTGGSLANSNITITGGAFAGSGGTGGILTYNIVDDAPDFISVTGGQMVIDQMNLDFSVDGPLTASSYLIAQTSGSGELRGGAFASASNIPAGWWLDYDLDGDNQGSIWLIPEPSTLALFGVAGLLLLHGKRLSTKRSS